MRRSLTRLALALAVVAGLHTTTAPPAPAVTLIASTFWGSMYVGPGGMGDPCTPIGTTNVPGCLPSVWTTTKTGPKGLPMVNTTVANGDTRWFSFSSVVCLNAGGNLDVGKQKLSPICGISAAGYITGFCGMASAAGNGAFTLNDVPLGPQAYTFTWKLTWLGSASFGYDTLLLTGTVTKATGGPSGEIVGRVELQADYDPWMANTCITGTATRFIVRGDMAIKIVGLI